MLPDVIEAEEEAAAAASLNAPTGAWCSLTDLKRHMDGLEPRSQCTYRCVVLPDLLCTVFVLG